MTGQLLAPTLREHLGGDGTHIAVLDLIIEIDRPEMVQWK
jgi:hypothetical protein